MDRHSADGNRVAYSAISPLRNLTLSGDMALFLCPLRRGLGTKARNVRVRSFQRHPVQAFSAV